MLQKFLNSTDIMSTTQTQQGAYIDRKVASKLLHVSIRTIDRYIRGGKLQAVQRNGRIWLEKKQVENFSTWDNAVPVVTVDTRAQKTTASAPSRSTPRPVSRPVERSVQVVSQQTNDSQFYKDLYEDAKVIIRDYQKKLENTQYRMNQMESQILSLQQTTHQTQQMPQLSQMPIRTIEIQDHGNRDEHFSFELLKKDFAQKEKEADLLRENFKREQTNKTIFAIIAYLLLAAQPVIWYLALQ